MLLSICIPTYNRSGFLGKLLESISNQKADFLYEVRIQDNASTDDTSEIAKVYCNRFENWHYELNEKNLGGKININKCTEKAIGEYLIIVGDDDTLVENGLSSIYAAIKDNIATAIFFSNKLGVEFSSCRKFEKGIDWIQKVAVNEPAFISSVVWKRTYWNNFDYYKNIETYHLPQLHCFINASLDNKTYGVNIELVDKGRENASNVATYWFYKFHALVDCFEYPYLYHTILSNHSIGFKNRMYIFGRKLKLFKEVLKKIAFMKNNSSEYEEYIKILKSKYKFPPFTLFIRVYIYILFNTSIGNKIALKICPTL
jgi:glycosyltransferase involved in cell wall biosynthesis